MFLAAFHRLEKADRLAGRFDAVALGQVLFHRRWYGATVQVEVTGLAGMDDNRVPLS